VAQEIEGYMSKLFPRVLAVIAMVSVLLLTGCGASTSSVPATVKQVPRIRAQELKALLDRGDEVIVVDTRSGASFEHMHISGAVSIPDSKIEARHGELSQEAKIVLYCT
jgi:hypothetical protein